MSNNPPPAVRKAGLERVTDNTQGADVVLPEGLITLFFSSELEARLRQDPAPKPRKQRRVLKL